MDWDAYERTEFDRQYSSFSALGSDALRATYAHTLQHLSR